MTTDTTAHGQNTRTVQFKDLQDHLVKAYANARTTPGLEQRWKNALDKAWAFFQSQPAISYVPSTRELLYPSESTVGTVYHANGVCQCPAYESGQPCKHRAASRLLHIALEQHEKEYNAELEKLAERYGFND